MFIGRCTADYKKVDRDTDQNLESLKGSLPKPMLLILNFVDAIAGT